MNELYQIKQQWIEKQNQLKNLADNLQPLVEQVGQRGPDMGSQQQPLQIAEEPASQEQEERGGRNGEELEIDVNLEDSDCEQDCSAQLGAYNASSDPANNLNRGAQGDSLCEASYPGNLGGAESDCAENMPLSSNSRLPGCENLSEFQNSCDSPAESTGKQVLRNLSSND